MPKVVNHEERRRAIAEVVLRLVAEEGVVAASFRRVARECGLSVGAVQHYFGSAEELANFAFDQIGARREARVHNDLRRLGRPPRERDVLYASLLSGLPLDAERRMECQAEVAWMSRYGAALEDHPGRKGLSELLDLFAGLLKDARARGVLVPGVEPDLEARVLWLLVVAQAQGALLGYSTPEGIRAVLDYHLARVLLPEPGELPSA